MNLRELEAKATPGPWYAEDVILYALDVDEAVYVGTMGLAADAELVVALRNSDGQDHEHEFPCTREDDPK